MSQAFVQAFPTVSPNTTASLGPVTMTAGNFGVVAAGGNANGSTITSITDNKGNLWVSTPNANPTQIWYCKSLVGGSTTMTLNFSGTAWPSLGNYFLEYSGVGGTSVRKDASAVANGSGASQSVGPILATNIDLVVAAMHLHVSNGSWTPGGGFTIRGGNSNALSFNAFDLVNAAAGSRTFTSTTNSAQVWEGTIVAFANGIPQRTLVGVGA
jgi:hypothetical protein